MVLRNEKKMKRKCLTVKNVVNKLQTKSENRDCRRQNLEGGRRTKGKGKGLLA